MSKKVIYLNKDEGRFMEEPSFQNLIRLARNHPQKAVDIVNTIIHKHEVTSLNRKEMKLWLLAYLQGVCSGSSFSLQANLDELEMRQHEHPMWKKAGWDVNDFTDAVTLPTPKDKE